MRKCEKNLQKTNFSLRKWINIEVKKVAKEFDLDDKLNIMAK